MVRSILCKSFPNLGGLLIFGFLLAMALMRLQTVQAQAEEEKKGSLGLHTSFVQAEQKTIPGSAPIELIAHGELEHGWLGISVQNLTPELARSFGMESTMGALVAEVAKGGQAEKAGMKQGDIVIVYGEKKITNASALRNEVATSTIGEQAKVTVLRKGKKVELAVTIGNMEDVTKLLPASVKERLGAEVKPVATPEEAQKYGLGAPQGVEIVWLDPKGPLGQVGFEVGDILLEINHHPIENFEGFVGLVSGLQPHQKIVVLALDHRSGNTGYVEVEVR